jgi:chitodextrinase
MRSIFRIWVVFGTILTGIIPVSSQKLSVYEVSKIPVSENAFSDISPVIYKNGLIFCSDRRFSSIKDKTGFDGRRLYNFYIAERKDSSHWDKPKLISNEMSGEFNNGPLSISPDGTTLFFTSEVETGKATKSRKFKNHTGIYIAELSGSLIKSVRPFRYNSMNYETGHPSISYDGKTLYFASDMPGGFGRSDIYFSTLVNGEWSSPVNMGPAINSSSAENFPYLHSDDRLYFSSDRPGGFGRLDIYSSSLFNGKWEDPVLLPDPVNSKNDDFAFVADKDLSTGYFSSNRTSDDDIFTFTSIIKRRSVCDPGAENSFCYRFIEENAVKFDSLPFIYRWKFGDGTTAEGSTVDHCFNGPGKYVVQLDVINLVSKEVISNEKTDTLILENIVQAYITSQDSVAVHDPVLLDAGYTNLPGWNITQYYWNFGDETIDTGVKVEKVFTRPGNYNVQLIVTAEPGPNGEEREACVSKNIRIITKP